MNNTIKRKGRPIGSKNRISSRNLIDNLVPSKDLTNQSGIQCNNFTHLRLCFNMF